MLSKRFATRLSRRPEPLDYALALGVAAGAVLFRTVLETIAPGIAYLVVLLPAVVIAGVFWGTAPAVVAALAGMAAISIFFVGRPLTAGPPFNSTQIDVLAFIPACAAVLWATHALRCSAANAATAEARLAEVFRQIPGAAAILEAPDGRLLLRSSQSDTVLAQPEREIGHSSDLGSYGGLHADGRPFAADDYPIVRALKTGEVVRGEHVRYRRSDGRFVDLEVHAGPVRGADGRTLAAVGMAFDITERMRAEQLLRDSEARYRAATEQLRAAIDAGTLGLWELNLATQRVWMDANCAEMFGLAAAAIDFDRADMMRFAHPADQSRASEVFAGALASGEPYADEIRMLTAQNEERWFVTRGVRLPGTQNVVGVIRDVTQRRGREEALRAALEAREVLMREADHRIKNSLQLVTSLLRLQLSRVEDSDAKHALEAAMIRVTAVSDAHLALQNSANLKSVEIDRILDDLCQRVALLNPAVTIRCDAAVELWLDADLAIPLGLMASELLTNALRHAFLPDTAGKVTLAAAVKEGMLQMTIMDDGVGLPETPVRHGLGTAVMTALTKQIGATLSTQSHSGLGTTVTICLELPTVSEVVTISPRSKTALGLVRK
jgi:two-component sensor histidine kinase/PAS domain-containing protein